VRTGLRATAMLVLPILLVFFLAQRWFARGIATPGLK
jgi:ABC-type glycerol-3-phosphate transport system permease component